MKHYIVNIAGLPFYQDKTWAKLVSIAQGTAVDERIGNHINVRCIRIRCNTNSQSVGGLGGIPFERDLVKVSLICEKKYRLGSGWTSYYTDVYPFALPREECKGQFFEIKDWMFDIYRATDGGVAPNCNHSSKNRCSYLIDEDIPVNIFVGYNGATTLDMYDNVISLGLIASNAFANVISPQALIPAGQICIDYYDE